MHFRTGRCVSLALERLAQCDMGTVHTLALGAPIADPALVITAVPAQEGYWGLAHWPSLCLESDQAVNLTSFALSLLLV